jgi:UDP:flavonoid glycosyltransferase YjiC (YdhE family)
MTRVRVLFTTTGSAGHLTPLLPFADACRDAGADVLIATRASMADRARGSGHGVWPFADAGTEERDALMLSARTLPTEEANRLVGAEVFGGLDARAAYPGVLEACEAWGPDVVVSEASEVAGRMAAAALSLPTVIVSITQYAIEHRMREVMDGALRRLLEEAALPASPAPARFTLMPPLLEDPAQPGPPETLRFRERPAAASPHPWEGEEPLVYLTFGSVAPQQAFFPALYRAAIDALAPLPVRVLVTIGRDRDPADLGPLPGNVRVERWLPQAEVLPHAAAVVCHGGSGTVRGALAAGVPVAVLPLFADQPDNAARVAALGAGVALEDAAGMAGAVEALLTDRSYAVGAAAVADDIRALPLVDAAVGALTARARPRPSARTARA